MMSDALLQRLRRSRDDEGVVAVVVALTMTVLLVMTAFTIDVGNWYLTASREQTAADAAALAGVPNLPGNVTGAFGDARRLAQVNGFTDGVATVTVTPVIADQPSRLRVTVSKTVQNYFGALVGRPTTRITRSAVADYVGPLPMGSPCNEFGDDPETGNRSANCADTGQFWANVGSRGATKASGDAYQDNTCSSGVDGCSGTTNTDYDPDGYYYVVTLKRAVANLRFEAFDPALVAVGDVCDNTALKGKNRTGAADARYAAGVTSPYCTGDIRFGGTGEVKTQFTVRQTGPSTTYWDPASYPAVTGCTTSFAGYNLPPDPATGPSSIASMPLATYNVFRRWTSLCSLASASAGQYMIQVRTNGLGEDAASGHNRFGLRVYSSTDSSAKDAVSIAGFSKMAIYANVRSARTTFFLTRVPSTAANQILSVKLFDIGDSTGSGTVSILSPSGAGLTGCTGTGRVTSMPTCSFTATSAFNGTWQVVSVPIPQDYTCNDADANACWFRLRYDYGANNQPSDTTSWSAGLDANPVRLIE